MKRSDKYKRSSLTSVHGIILMTIIVTYLLIASFMWSIQNPTANHMQFWVHLDKALTFQSLDEFQPKERINYED